MKDKGLNKRKFGGNIKFSSTRGWASIGRSLEGSQVNMLLNIREEIHAYKDLTEMYMGEVFILE